MKRLRINLALLVLLLAVPMPVGAVEETPEAAAMLIISEVKIKNDSVGLNEYIELYNPGADPVLLSRYNLEYFNSSAPAASQQPVKAVIADGLLPPKSSFVLAKDISQIADAKQSPFTSLSDTAGSLRLTDQEGQVLDSISWNSSLAAAIAPIVHLPTSSNTKSFQRNTDENGQPVTGPATWSLSIPAPISTLLLTLPAPEETPPEDNEETPPIPGEEELVPDIEENPQPVDTGIPAEETPEIVLLPLQITELLPNPKSPETDNNDEFVELYNPNAEPIDLSGYKIQTGANYTYTYTFTEGTVPGTGHMIVTSGNSNLSLANTTGRARLISPLGTVVSETAPYEDADDGMAWALLAGSWQWTTTPTPLAQNTLTLPVIEPKPVPLPKAAVKKAAKPKPAAKPAVKAASTKKAKASTAKTPKSTKAAAVAAPAEADVPPPLHPAVLAGVSGLAVLYAGYEYRHDAANRIYQLRSYRAARRAARAASAGR